MRQILSKRPSPGTVLAVVAIVLSIGGSATAASIVTSRQIKNNSITSSDLKNNSVKSADVRNGSLLRKDFKRSQLPVGATGPQGAAGRNGIGTLNYPSRSVTHANGADGRELVAPCAPGTYPTGGTAVVFEDLGPLHPELLLDQGFKFGPDGRPNGWFAFVADNNTGNDVQIVVSASCTTATSPPAP
jgi:hypothetical protein